MLALATAGVLVLLVVTAVPLALHRQRRHRPPGGPGPVPAPIAPAPQARPEADDPRERAVALGEDLRALVRRANAAGGRLPTGAVPAVRAVEDVLRPLLAFVAAQSASPEEVRELTAIITGYLPTAVDRYLALPEHYAATATTAGGGTPAQELLEQLRLLHDGSNQLATAIYDSDAQALAVGRRFLDAKFSRSDLDL